MFGTDRRLKTLGKFPSISLAEARKAAKQFQIQGAQEKHLERLDQARAAYLLECQQKNRPKTVEQYRLFLHKVNKTYLADVNRDDIDLTSPHAVMAWKVFFNWSIRNEYAEKNPFAHIPARWVKRSRVLTEQEVRAIWAYDHPPYSDYVKLLILTDQRINQLRLFRPEWKHNGVITFPPEAMKNGYEHLLPVASSTEQYFDRLQLFNGWSKAKKRLDKQVPLPHWRLHDLRRTFSTFMAANNLCPVHVTEAILAHKSGTLSGVAGVYNRYNYLGEMREACNKYENWLSSKVLMS